jgi:hypothetical protein
LNNLFDALMGGNVNDVMREMEATRKETERRNIGNFMEGFQSAMTSELRPALIHWLRNGGTHEPRCGRDQKGDLLRWVDGVVNKQTVRLPSVRVDMLDIVCAGKIEVKGTELLKWAGSKLDSKTRNLFIAVRRSQKKDNS